VSARTAITFILTSLGLVVPGLAQAPVVTSARVVVESRPAPALIVWIENDRETAIVGWEIRTIRDGKSAGHASGGHTLPAERQPPGTGAILPGERRRLRLSLPDVRPTDQARLTMVLFADGSFAGVASHLATRLDRDEKHAVEIEYWLDVFHGMPRTPADAIAFLRGHVAERARLRVGEPYDRGPDIERWITSSPPETWTFERAEAYRKRLEQELVRVTRYRAHRAAHGVGSMTLDDVGIEAVGLRQESAGVDDPVIYIENLRDVPIDAWQHRFTTAPVPGPGGVGGRDMCGQLDRPGEGPIQPGERREIPLAIGDLTDALPHVVVEGALWTDGHFEGDVAWRRRIFDNRQADARVLNHWIALLREAAAMAPREALAFLREKDEERKRQFPRERSLLGASVAGWTKMIEDPGADLGQVLARHADMFDRRARCGQ
jgi:hypothetical protein